MIKKTYNYHMRSEEGLAMITQLREAFSKLNELIESICPNSRERAVTITNIETAAMWAIKSVVFNDPKSEVE